MAKGREECVLLIENKDGKKVKKKYVTQRVASGHLTTSRRHHIDWHGYHGFCWAGNINFQIAQIPFGLIRKVFLGNVIFGFIL